MHSITDGGQAGRQTNDTVMPRINPEDRSAKNQLAKF